MQRTILGLAAASILLAGCTETQDFTTAPDPAFSAGAPAPQPSAVFQLVAPIFGLDTSPDGSLLAAETLVGVTEIRKGGTNAVASLGGISDVAAIGRGNMLAITGEGSGPTAHRLFRISQGRTREIADLGAFEAAVNPDQSWNPNPPDSNPFGIAHLHGGTALVADAAGNSILIVDESGSVDWVAVLTPQLASTEHFRTLIGCFGDAPPPNCPFIPAALPAEPVATSIAVGPDGAWYAGELTGFPGTPGISRVWRIAAGSRHVLCPSAACTLVATGFTAIMDLAFGPDGTLYVVEFDLASWIGPTFAGSPLQPMAGGRVQACNVATGSCTIRAQGLSLPSAITVGKDGTVWVAENDAIEPAPGHIARVRALP